MKRAVIWYAKDKEAQEKGDMLGEISLIDATQEDLAGVSDQPPKGKFGWVRIPPHLPDPADSPRLPRRTQFRRGPTGAQDEHNRAGQAGPGSE